MAVTMRLPRRGEIWFVKLPVDPPGKGLRPVVIVSVDARNQNERASTILGIPLTTSIHRDIPTRARLAASETGLPEDSAACCENITMMMKEDLVEPRARLRQISDTRICQLMQCVGLAAGCV